MRLTADYHTHTVHSHGTGTMADNIEAAIAIGLKEIAITDHGLAHMAYGIKDMDKYLADIDEQKKRYAGRIKVLSGIELNLTSLRGDTDMPQEIAGRFDVRIMGYHKFVAYRGPRSYWHFYAGARIMKHGLKERTTDAYLLAMERGGISIISHPGYGLPVDISRLAEGCREYNVLFEINSSHPGLRSEDIATAYRSGARLVVSSDAHSPENIGNVKFAFDKIRESGIPTDTIVNIAREAEQ